MVTVDTDILDIQILKLRLSYPSLYSPDITDDIKFSLNMSQLAPISVIATGVQVNQNTVWIDNEDDEIRSSKETTMNIHIADNVYSEPVPLGGKG